MIDEAKKLGLGTTMHHSPPVYPEVNAVETGRHGARDRHALLR